jgi:protein phosphatase PTC7
MSKEARKKIFFTSNQAGERRYEFKLAWGLAPHPDKVWKGGEDALYVSKNILIVADGVGGWSRMGIDSGVYARRLIAAVKELLEAEKELYFVERPEELAAHAVQRNEEKGSATLSIITLHPITGIVRSYHIGDSVFGIFSQSGKNFMAEELQREFNVPFQVFGGKNNAVKNDSDSEDEQPVSDVFNGNYNQFSHSETVEKRIVLASDGLWDNLHEDEIQQLLFSNGNDLTAKTKTIVRRAK